MDWTEVDKPLRSAAGGNRTVPTLRTSAGTCATCNGRCCSEYTVTVIGYDVWVLATRLRLAPQEFLIYFPAQSDSPETFRLDQTGARFDMALDKVADDRPQRPCIFLAELPGGCGRCGIHAHRPFVCQTYPAYLDLDVVTLRHDVMCPVGAWKLSQMDVRGWREQMNAFVVQRDIYERVVDCWNRRVDAALPGRQFSIDHYYDFLMNVYGRLTQTDREMGDEQLDSVLRAWNRQRARTGNPLLNGQAVAENPAGIFGTYVQRVAGILCELAPQADADVAGADVGTSVERIQC